MKYNNIKQRIPQIAKIYFVGVGIAGFHRGYCNQYSGKSALQHQQNSIPIINKKLYKLSSYEIEHMNSNNLHPDLNESNLITEKITYGLASSIYYINPCLHMFVLYSCIKRMEKRIRNIPMDKFDWYW